MRKTYGLVGFLALPLLGVGTAAAQDIQHVCRNQVPAGYIATDKKYSITECGTFSSATDNVWVVTRYDHLPVGARMDVCADQPIPAGWQAVRSTQTAQRCSISHMPTSPTVTEIAHVSCVNQSHSSCYPPSGSWISVWPQKAIVPPGQSYGWTDVSYGSGAGACIWIHNTGAPAPTLWTCGGPQGTNIRWDHVPAGGETRFILSPSMTSPSPELASKTIRAPANPAASISASPLVVSVPAGTNFGSTTISYQLPGASGACVWTQNSGEAPKLWSCGAASATLQWSYVPRGGSSTFWLTTSWTASEPRLATVTVTGR
ncbi:hypothetical protein [Tahibacter amnicola]|uniref:Ricin B lectin domain-containing protein n=1 Tax=Tahibacter amnicola TaxID=2976241 RepID=A0ABY6BKH9_9GAMM|nr:hypothetical protein [Tahibacter amnicola]UXI70277.1 hypothetical protein N4264_11770 [Tahibacter amnicola]